MNLTASLHRAPSVNWPKPVLIGRITFKSMTNSEINHIKTIATYMLLLNGSLLLSMPAVLNFIIAVTNGTGLAYK